MAFPQRRDRTIHTDSLDHSLRWHGLCYNNVQRIPCICLNDALLRRVTLYFWSIFRFQQRICGFLIFTKMYFSSILMTKTS